ncbi:MAG: PHP domain-containing protein [Nitrospirae bacterium GWD2_57_9]|nr:MAG: PHP domain-containing protein [Nitrospirae bacterium GWD2_57_9]OGW48622.1 MAG: PHP domain-containing protein [Nitrospirae bacterium GWC2_57_9]
MIDLHTHSLFSDGVLVPSELVRRAFMKGYEVIAITDHADASNLDFAIPRVAAACKELSSRWKITALPGIELTHIPPETFTELTKQARALGAAVVVAHGETLVEPVHPGTNRAAIEARVDILAHPGLITKEEAELAARNGVCLEITSRKGHSLSNGHVARIAGQAGAKLVIDTDSHEPGDLITDEFARQVLLGCGLNETQIGEVLKNSRELTGKARAGIK